VAAAMTIFLLSLYPACRRWSLHRQVLHLLGRPAGRARVAGRDRRAHSVMAAYYYIYIIVAMYMQEGASRCGA